MQLDIALDKQVLPDDIASENGHSRSSLRICALVCAAYRPSQESLGSRHYRGEVKYPTNDAFVPKD